MGKSDAFLLLGSNLDADLHMRRAMEELPSHFEVVAASPLIESRPVGMPEGTSDFLNRAVWIRTDLPPRKLYVTLKEIELRLGRTPDQKGLQSRIIDVDVLLVDGRIEKTDLFEIPHPDIEQHYYVAFLLAELCPDRRHPVSGRTMREIAAALHGAGHSGIRPVSGPPPENS